MAIKVMPAMVTPMAMVISNSSNENPRCFLKVINLFSGGRRLLWNAPTPLSPHLTLVSTLSFDKWGGPFHSPRNLRTTGQARDSLHRGMFHPRNGLRRRQRTTVQCPGLGLLEHERLLKSLIDSK